MGERAAEHGQRIEFSGSGSEYFKIWLVNIALSVLTLGIYSAWAKVRREQYFARNTRLAQSSFDYHAKPIPILIGRIIMLALLGSIWLGRFLPQLAGIAMLIFIPLVPFFLQRSIRFRLGNTSWRGLRFAFLGTIKKAYFLFGKYALLIGVAVAILIAATAMHDQAGKRTFGFGAALAIGLLIFALPIVAWFLFISVKRYAIGNAAFGNLHFALKASRKEFFKLLLKSIGVTLAIYLLLSVAIGMSAGVLFGSLGPLRGAAAQRDKIGLMLLGLVATAAGYGAYAVISSYWRARLQRLIWNRTTLGPHRFICDLRARSLSALTLKNWVLTALTLGFYRPFAAVNTARLRAESIRLMPIGDFEATATAAIGAGQAAGSEILDALDVDIAF
jgi:uncharacterized membrane protein YjgN (DUF898 family)